MSTILSTLDCQRDSKNSYNYRKIETKRWIATPTIIIPKTEGSLGLRRGGVISQHWPLPLAVEYLYKLHQLPVLDVFFYLLRLSERAYKGHTAFISSSSSFSFLMLDFLVIWLHSIV